MQSSLGEQINAASSSRSSSSSSSSSTNNFQPPPPLFNPLTRLTQQQPLPNVAHFVPRTLTYQSANQQQALVPKTFFQWTVFILSLPFKFIFSSLNEFVSFFWSFFEPSPLAVGDHDPLANVAEFAIDYTQKYGINHVDFYQGSYSQAVNQARRELKFLMVYLHQNDNKDCDLFAT